LEVNGAEVGLDGLEAGELLLGVLVVDGGENHDVVALLPNKTVRHINMKVELRVIKAEKEEETRQLAGVATPRSVVS